MIKRDRLQYLFERYLKNIANNHEKQELAEHINEVNEDAIADLLRDVWESPIQEESVFTKAEAESILKNILINKEFHQPNNRYFIFRWPVLAAAAAILVLLCVSAFFLLNTREPHQAGFTVDQISPESDILPGGIKAVLTLDGGGRILLDTVSNGMISHQEGALVVKSGDGKLEYKSDQTVPRKVAYNTVSTPIGGEYQLTLPDGSKVWLNAASSIKFPTAFNAKVRQVTITGEVYFEVNAIQTDGGKSVDTRKHGNVPFLVDIDGKGIVEVLGTHFNINSYASEKAIKTTLLEGSISFTSNANPGIQKSGDKQLRQQPVLIAPGTQLSLNPDGKIEIDENVDMENVMAWKNGYFLFSYNSLPEVMSQISRWYDIEVIFEGPISDRKFAGKMQRELKLSEILKILEKNNIRFRLEGRNLYVTK